MDRFTLQQCWDLLEIEVNVKLHDDIDTDESHFGVQRTHTMSYKSQCPPNTCDCLVRFVDLWKWGRRNNFVQQGSLSHHDKRFFLPSLHGIDVNKIFGFNRIRYHTPHNTIDLLHQTFDFSLINRNSDVDWQTRSWDLTPFYNFWWGGVKEKCKAFRPEIIEHLKVNIRDAIADMHSKKDIKVRLIAPMTCLKFMNSKCKDVWQTVQGSVRFIS